MMSRLQHWIVAIIIIAAASLIWTAPYASNEPGGFAIGTELPLPESANPREGVVQCRTVDGDYTTYTYTFSDLVIFSYQDDTSITVTNSIGVEIWSGTLGQDSYTNLSPGEGVFGVSGSQPFSLLMGDPISQSVLGYFAMNERGLGVGTKLMTYMPSNIFGTELFIVFGYHDDTSVTITNLNSGAVLWTGVLDRGEHFTYDEQVYIPILVEASEPVSALSYADQGYLIPGEDGRWIGTQFFGYAGYLGGWVNDLNIVSHHDGNYVVIRDSESGVVLWEGGLNRGDVHNMALGTSSNQNVYFEVSADLDVCASIAPFGTWSSSYYHLLDITDTTGQRIGTEFFATALSGGRMDFSSFTDENVVEITNLNSGVVELVTTLQAGDHLVHSTNNVHYRIESTGALAGCESYGGSFGGAFVPVYYGLDLPDLELTRSNIGITPTAPDFIIEATVSNVGSNAALDGSVDFYLGDPERGGRKFARRDIDPLNPGEEDWVLTDLENPVFPEHMMLFVTADPDDDIREGNENNNTAWRPLISNDDLAPPLSLTINAVSGLDTDEDGLFVPDPFEIDLLVSNISDLDQLQLTATLLLPPGLQLPAPETQEHGPFDVGSGALFTTTWSVSPDASEHGWLPYEIEVSGPSTTTKTIRRAIWVPPVPFNTEITASWEAACVAEAEIYVDRGAGYELLGTTGIGTPVQANHISLGDRLRARYRLHNEPAVKSDHGDVDDRMFELWVDSDIMQSDGEHLGYEITEELDEYCLVMNRPTFLYNMVVSIEDEADEPFYSALEEGLRNASRCLYDATDGQARFGKIVVFDDKEHWGSCDLRIHNDDRRPNATPGGIDWDDIWIYEWLLGTINMGRTRTFNDGQVIYEPNETRYYSGIAHEFGHYAFGMYDEYTNGYGLEWKSDSWNQGGPLHPYNYGMMQSDGDGTEFSSANDYLREYPLIPNPGTVTEQYWERRMSCFNWLQTRLLDYYDGVAIQLPPFGWYPDGFIADRTGPEGIWVEDATEVIDRRGFRGRIPSRTTTVVASLNGSPLPGADVFVERDHNGSRVHLGFTDLNGELGNIQVRSGDKIAIYRQIEGEYQFEKLRLTEELIGGNLIFDLDRTEAGPGVVLNGGLLLEAGAPRVLLNLRVDEALTGDPTVTIHHGGETGEIELNRVGTTDLYSGEFTAPTGDPLYDGSGSLEIMMNTVEQGITTLSTRYKILPVFNSTRTYAETGTMLLVIPADLVADNMGCLILDSGATPYAPPRADMYPVGDMHDISLSSSGGLSGEPALNLYYSSEDLHGLDESSLGLFKWESGTAAWEAIDGATHSPAENLISALVPIPGLYAIFATLLSDDAVEPDRIEDLGARTGASQGEVILNWTAPGDDGDQGTALNYLLRVNTVPITHQNWDTSIPLEIYTVPDEAGTEQSCTVVLPNENRLYYFSLAAVDEAGNMGAPSNFAEAISSVAAYTFSLLSPAFDTFAPSPPTLEWEPLEIPPSDGYTVWIASEETFLGHSEVIVSEGTTLTLDGSQILNDMIFWKVVANSGDEETWCNQSYFLFNTDAATPGTGGALTNSNVYAYPNPVDPSSGPASIRFSVERDGDVKIRIYDVSNTLVITLIDGVLMRAGVEQAVSWDGRNGDGKDVANGIYFYVIESTNGERAVGKLAVKR